MEMYEENDFDEEKHVTEQREASLAGLLAGVFLLFLVGAGAVGLITFWPVVKNAPVSPLFLSLKLLSDPGRMAYATGLSCVAPSPSVLALTGECP